MGIHNHLRGSAAGLIYQILSIAIGLVLTPLLLSTLGSGQFGVWILLSVVIAYESLSDLGITAAIVYFVNKTRSFEEKNRLITAAVLANMGLTLLAICILLVLKDPILDTFFKVPPEYLSETELAYNLTLITLIFLVMARSLAAVIDSFQCVDVRFSVEAVGLMLWAGLAWTAVIKGFGIVGLALATLLVGVVRAIAMLLASYWVYPQFRLHFGLPRSILSRLIRYGMKVQGASLGLTLSDPLLKSLTATGLNTVAVGSLQIGGSIAAVPNSLAHSTIATLFPAIAERSGSNDLPGAINLAGRYLLYVVGFVLPISVFFLFEAPIIVGAWLHDTHPLIVTSMRLLTVAFLFRAFSMVPWRVSWGFGSPQDSSVAMTLHIGLLAGLGTFLLVSSSMTLDKILIVYVISYAASTLFLFWRMGYSLAGFYSTGNSWLFWAIARVFLISIFACALYLFVSQLNQLTEFMHLLFAGMILALSYLAIFFLAIPKRERSTLMQALGSSTRALFRHSY